MKKRKSEYRHLNKIDERINYELYFTENEKTLTTQLKMFSKIDTLNILETPIKSLHSLTEINHMNLTDNKTLKSLGLLKRANTLVLVNTVLEDLGNLKEVSYLYLNGNKTLKSLGKLKKVDWLDIRHTNIRDINGLYNPGTIIVSKDNKLSISQIQKYYINILVKD